MQHNLQNHKSLLLVQQKFRPVHHPSLESFVPGELYCMDRNWVFYPDRKLEVEDILIDIPACVPFMYLGMHDYWVKIMQVLVNGKTIAFHDMKVVIDCIKHNNCSLYELRD